jgi:twinkle protein
LEDNQESTYEYLEWRGVTRNTFRQYGVKTKVAASGQPTSIGFTYPSGATKVRLLGKKEFFWQGDHIPGLFGLDKFNTGSHKYVAITEGELDACSLWQITQVPCLSVQSSSSAVADVVAARDYLAGFERIYLAFDGDAPGRDAAAMVARLFDYNKVYHVKFSRPDRKDANSYVEHNEGDVLLNVFLNARKYVPEQIITHLDEFKEILNEDHKMGVPFPIPSLNDKTYGIHQGYSYLITAEEGVGKTELMHAIEYQLLKRTNDNVGAIFLEEPKRRHLQAIAGLELKLPVHLPDSPTPRDQVMAALSRVVGRDERLFIYSHFGSDDPDVLLDTIRFLVTACSCRYILMDHISMAVSGLAGDDERRALDYLSTRLEMMVKELDFALIFVSHVNDDGKTRGSRYIAKVADVRIDLSRDVRSGSNTTSILVSKNRFSGKTGPAGSYVFDSVSHTIHQDEAWPNEVTKEDARTISLVPTEPGAEPWSESNVVAASNGDESSKASSQSS